VGWGTLVGENGALDDHRAEGPAEGDPPHGAADVDASVGGNVEGAHEGCDVTNLEAALVRGLRLGGGGVTSKRL
jgi:hypothetical protein